MGCIYYEVDDRAMAPGMNGMLLGKQGTYM